MDRNVIKCWQIVPDLFLIDFVFLWLMQICNTSLHIHANTFETVNDFQKKANLS